MNAPYEEFAKLNRGFDELLAESNDEENLADDEATVQNLIVPVESDSSEDDDGYDESDDDKEEMWAEDAVIHDRFTFATPM
ncbi:hypothetical protein RB195_019553 [Necator americanus]|uniref:Uncharacterized protein n=1 Tax=Necator americanus TaxID=51031 RepID=A0ABR1CER4_NECAM